MSAGLERSCGPHPAVEPDWVHTLASSDPLGWDGAHVAVVEGTGYEDYDVVASGQFAAVQLSTAPTAVRVRDGRRASSVVFGPGSAWTLPPGESVRHGGHGYCRYVSVEVEHDWLLRHGVRPSRSTDTHMYTNAKTEFAAGLKVLAQEAVAGWPSGTLFAEAVLTAAADALYGLPGKAALPHTGLPASARRVVLELIEFHVGAASTASLSVETLAREVRLSPAHFARAFRSAVGVAPHRYVMRRRLVHARRLLDAGFLTPAQIAVETGFSDQSHFGRCFRSQFGMTPGRYLTDRHQARGSLSD